VGRGGWRWCQGPFLALPSAAATPPLHPCPLRRGAPPPAHARPGAQASRGDAALCCWRGTSAATDPGACPGCRDPAVLPTWARGRCAVTRGGAARRRGQASRRDTRGHWHSITASWHRCGVGASPAVVGRRRRHGRRLRSRSSKRRRCAPGPPQQLSVRRTPPPAAAAAAGQAASLRRRRGDVRCVRGCVIAAGPLEPRARRPAVPGARSSSRGRRCCRRSMSRGGGGYGA
jgi:hypothetical protein